MKKLIVFLPLLFSVVLSFSQNTVVHDDHAQVRNVGSFHAIEVSSGIHLILKQGTEAAVAVSAASPELRDRIRTEVEGGKLKIYFNNKGLIGWEGKKDLKAYVSFKDLDKLEANSGADASVDGTINVNDLGITLSSGADFDGKVSVQELNIDQSSGADMDISGKSNNLSITVSSGADFSGYDLATENCKANASSGGNIKITVNKTLEADASSGGGIDYKGNGVITNVSNSSGGRVKKQG
jgi:hypothetical protein